MTLSKLVLCAGLMSSATLGHLAKAQSPATETPAYGANTYLRIGGQVVRFQISTALTVEQKQKLQTLLSHACFVEERAPASVGSSCTLPIVWPIDTASTDNLAIYCDGRDDDCLTGSTAPRLKIGPAETTRAPIAANVSAYIVPVRGAAAKLPRPRLYEAKQ